MSRLDDGISIPDGEERPPEFVLPNRSLRLPDLFSPDSDFELFIGRRYEVVKTGRGSFELKEITEAAK